LTSLLKNENVAAIVDEPSGVVVSTKETTFNPSRPTLLAGVVPLFTKRTSAVATFSQVRNEASIAANSLPFTSCGDPRSLIQYETGIEDHFGVSPNEAVMRVYAQPLAQKTNINKMQEYFFKVDDLETFGFEL
jgi:hypothetical protein